MIPRPIKFRLRSGGNSVIAIKKILMMFMVIIFFSSAAFSETIVKVGGYIFPPFVEKIKVDKINTKLQGVTLDLIELFNNNQKKYRFIFVETSPKRRYKDLKYNFFDTLFFESIQWGWQGKGVEASRMFLKGGEVYIASSSPEKGADYFDSFKGKSTAGLLGYHYGFAGFDADETFLKKTHNMTLFTKPKMLFAPVLKNRINIAVVTDSYLKKYIAKHPQIKEKLLISEKYDQVYNHTILSRKGSSISALDFNALLDAMEKKGLLDQLWKSHGFIK